MKMSGAYSLDWQFMLQQAFSKYHVFPELLQEAPDTTPSSRDYFAVQPHSQSWVEVHN